MCSRAAAGKQAGLDVDSVDPPKAPHRVQVAIVNGNLVMDRLMGAVRGLLLRPLPPSPAHHAGRWQSRGPVCRTRAAPLAITHPFSSLSASSKRHMARARR